MSPSPRIVYEHPNDENTIPFGEYQSSSPEKFSLPDDDKLVIYGGGEGYMATILDKDPSVEVSVTPEIHGLFHSQIWMFVLNTAVILWTPESNIGIELPYQSILLHALQDAKLYLQVSSSDVITCKTTNSEFIPTIEMEISAIESQPHKQLGIFKRVPGAIDSLYHAMMKCSDMRYDSESDSDMDGGFDFAHSSLNDSYVMPSLAVPEGWITTDESIKLYNDGDADDLEDIHEEEDPESSTQSPQEPEEAGMHVDVGFGPVAGVVRRRESDDKQFQKVRKT